MKNKFSFLLSLTTAFFVSFQAKSAEVDMNMAQMQAMDKITGRVSIIEIPVGGEVQFGTFSIVVRSCKARTEEEIPENFAFVDVADKSFNKEEYNIFKGWMLSSSPAVNAVEHPIYDVWLLKCFNANVKKEQLLSENELAKRDNLPRLNEIREQVAEISQNTLSDHNVKNIVFKDSMYKEQPVIEERVVLPEKIDGEPQNLLNIQDSYETQEETFVDVSSEEFLKALEQEAEKSIEENRTVNVDLNDDLESEIDAELKKARSSSY